LAFVKKFHAVFTRVPNAPVSFLENMRNIIPFYAVIVRSHRDCYSPVCVTLSLTKYFFSRMLH